MELCSDMLKAAPLGAVKVESKASQRAQTMAATRVTSKVERLVVC